MVSWRAEEEQQGTEDQGLWGGGASGFGIQESCRCDKCLHIKAPVQRDWCHQAIPEEAHSSGYKVSAEVRIEGLS